MYIDNKDSVNLKELKTYNDDLIQVFKNLVVYLKHPKLSAIPASLSEEVQRNTFYNVNNRQLIFKRNLLIIIKLYVKLLQKFFLQ